MQGGRCVRACREEQVKDVIGYAFRGERSKIVFDLDDPMGGSTCVACGECVQACPTGALMPAREVGKIQADKSVDSVCPYCGVGCLLTYNVKGNKILWVQGREGPANSNRLCVKGRYGFDYVQHKHRLTKPLIRRPGMKKHKDFVIDPDNWSQVDRKSTRLNSSHQIISYAVFCLKKKNTILYTVVPGHIMHLEAVGHVTRT